MDLQRVPFARHSYQSRSLPVSAQQCLNLYPEAAPPDAKSQLVLFGTPGLKPFADVAGDGVRGLHEVGGTLYAVSGTTLYSVDSGGTATVLGTIAGTAPVFMEDNGSQLLIGADANSYVYSSSTLAEITDPDFPGASSWTYLDGYGIFTEPNTGKFWITALLDFTDVDALDFASAESLPDNLVRCFADHRELWLFGTRSTEVWYNSGNADFPFERIGYAALERGLAGKYTVAKMDNTVFWVGDDKVVYRAEGYTPTRISTHAIEHAISGLDLSAATAFAYTQEGHAFYVLNVPGYTFVHDASNGLWHERQGYGLDRWRADCFVRAYDKLLVGDYAAGKIYELDLDTYTDAGDPIQRIATTAPIHKDGLRVFHHSLQIEVESGAGLTTGQGSDPQAMLQWSDDGGRTWSNERWTTMGAIGEYKRRARWTRLGSARERIYRQTISDPIKVAIIAANLNTTVGNA